MPVAELRSFGHGWLVVLKSALGEHSIRYSPYKEDASRDYVSLCKVLGQDPTIVVDTKPETATIPT